MARFVYTKAKEKIMTKQVDLVGDTIKTALVANTYTPNATTDEFYSTIAAHVLDEDITLTSKSVAGGAFDAADVTWSAVAAGDTALGVVTYMDTGNPATSILLHFNGDVSGFPFTTNGSDVTVNWDNGAFKIFAF